MTDLPATLTTYADPDDDIQVPCDAGVIIPTVLGKTVVDAVRSVFQQDFDGKIHLLIGIDLPRGSLSILNAVLDERPSNIRVTVFWPGYSTNIRHGGLWRPWGGGALRTILSFLANARHITYLDDDDWYAPTHIRLLKEAIKGKNWAYSLRWMVKNDRITPICVDTWESVGPDRGVFAPNFGGYVDTNSLMIDKIKLGSLLAHWCVPFGGESKGGEDRSIFKVLREKGREPGTTNKPTSSYCLDETDVNAPTRQKFINEHQIPTGPEHCPGWSGRPQPNEKRRAKVTKHYGNIYHFGDTETIKADVCVVMPTILHDTIDEAIQSIFDQDFNGTIHLLIGIDKGDIDPLFISTLMKNCPSHVQVTLFHPGYSTSARHGGIHQAYDGGSLRTILSFLSRSPLVAYLDDDNRWHKNHLSSLRNVIADNHYAFSLRRFIHPDRETLVATDRWESVGPFKGLYSNKFKGFIDPNCLMINIMKAFQILPCWAIPLSIDPEKMSADRVVFHNLSKYGRGIASNQASVDYVLNINDPMHGLRAMYLGYRWTNADCAARKKRLGLMAPTQQGQKLDS